MGCRVSLVPLDPVTKTLAPSGLITTDSATAGCRPPPYRLTHPVTPAAPVAGGVRSDVAGVEDGLLLGSAVGVGPPQAAATSASAATGSRYDFEFMAEHL